MKKKTSPHELLQKALERQKRKNPSYSMRALARRLQLSPSFIGAIFQGKKRVPLERVKEIAQALGMDVSAQKTLREAVALEALEKNNELSAIVKEHLENENFQKKSSIAASQEKTLLEFSILEAWYYIPLLDLVTCTDFIPEPRWIADRLSITQNEADRAFKRLQETKMIELQAGKWCKVEEKIRFPTTRSHPSIRQYHKTMIQKALYTLLNETSDEDFERRLITSISFAANPKKITKAKEYLMEALYKVADIMAEGNDHTELYQLNAQLIPLTRKRK